MKEFVNESLNRKEDDLAELRKMIKETKVEIQNYAENLY
jgi:hypothetical protein